MSSLPRINDSVTTMTTTRLTTDNDDDADNGNDNDDDAKTYCNGSNRIYMTTGSDYTLQ